MFNSWHDTFNWRNIFLGVRSLENLYGSDLDFCKNDSFPEKIFFWQNILATGTGSDGLDELKDELNANKIRRSK